MPAMSTQRIALGIEYDGSAFHGWQAQQHVHTVQAEVEQALSKVADHPVGVVCAGRTDAGVHATGQVVHFDTHARRSMRSWILGTNTHLSPAVVVRWAVPVTEEFHARFSAQRRGYRYIILNRFVRPALQQGRVTWYHGELDAPRMHQAAQGLLGRQDFSSFRALACQAKSPVRTVHAVSVQRQGEYIFLDIEADGFLHHMVRNIAGVLLAIGRGEQPPEWVMQLLSLRDRTQGGVTAPPDGLYLKQVVYDPIYQLPPNHATCDVTALF